RESTPGRIRPRGAHEPVQRVVVVDDDSVEQRTTAGNGAPPLYLHERSVLDRPNGELAGAGGLQKGQGASVVPNADAHGEGVDEQADHGAGIGKDRPAAGARRAEHDVVLPRITVKEDSPRSLNKRVEGETVRGGEALQPFGRVGTEHDLVRPSSR